MMVKYSPSSLSSSEAQRMNPTMRQRRVNEKRSAVWVKSLTLKERKKGKCFRRRREESEGEDP